MDGVGNPCSLEQYGVGFPSLVNTKRLIPACLSMIDEKECYSSHLRSGWHGFPSGCPSGVLQSTRTNKSIFLVLLIRFIQFGFFCFALIF